jgi:hypothetical protein
MSFALFIQVLASEVRKLRRTPALGMVFLAPFTIVILYFVVGLASPGPLARGGAERVWPSLIQNTVMLWTLLMLPMFITLETSLLAGLEHTERNWKFVLTMPMPRWMVYIAKLVVVVGMVWTAHLVLGVGTMISGVTLRTFSPELGLTTLPVWPLVESLTKVGASLLLGLSIQHWVSVRFPSFTVAIGFGMAAMVVAFIAANSATYGPWYPWSLPLHAIRPRPGVVNPMWVSLAGAGVVAIAGAWHFHRRDVA